MTTSLKLVLIVSIVLAPLGRCTAGDLIGTRRTWTDQQGRTLFAELAFVDARGLCLRDERGKEFVLSFSNLSAADQEYVRRRDPTIEAARKKIDEEVEAARKARLEMERQRQTAAAAAAANQRSGMDLTDKQLFGALALGVGVWAIAAGAKNAGGGAHYAPSTSSKSRGIHGRVTNSDGRPVRDAKVMLIWRGPVTVGEVETVKTDENGRFYCDGLTYVHEARVSKFAGDETFKVNHRGETGLLELRVSKIR